jgi:phage terminase small subunit
MTDKAEAHGGVMTTDLTERVEQLPEMAALPTDQMRQFVENLFVHPNHAQAARAAGYGRRHDGQGESTAHAMAVISNRLLRDPRIIAARNAAQKILRRQYGPKALNVIGHILDDPQHKDAYKAARDILELEDTTVTKTETTVNVKVDHTRDALDTLRYMKSIGATREMLEAHFGFSGLSRYEELLAIEDRKSANVIDGEFTEVKSIDPMLGLDDL